MTAPEIILIITTTSTGIVSIIGAMKNSAKLDDAKNKALQQDIKLDNIHQVTNSSLDKALAKVNELVEENQKLKEDVLKFNQRQRLP